MARLNPPIAQRRRPQQRRAQHTVEVFFRAATELMETYGEAGLSTNKVAEHARLSVGTLYQYFENKEQLVGAMSLRGQALVMDKLDAYLSPFEMDPVVALQDSQPMLRGLVDILVEGFARGKTTPHRPGFGRTLIRLAWTWENPADSAAMAGQIESRLRIYFETIRHPALPPPNSGPMFVMVRGVLGVLRYLSLTQSPMLEADDLTDRLTLLAQTAFLGRMEASSQDRRNAAVQHRSTHEESPKQPVSLNAVEMELLKSGEEQGLRHKPTQKRAAETIGTIFKALLQVLDAEGGDGLTTIKVAKRSGFSVGALYKYFPDKKKLVWAASLYGARKIYQKLDAYLAHMEAEPETARLHDLRQIMREATFLYLHGLAAGTATIEGGFFNQPLVRLGWLWENPHDTYGMTEQVSARLKDYWENLQHPAYPEKVDYPTILVASLALISVIRSASLEQSPLQNDKTLEDALVNLAVVMHTGKA